MVLTPTQIIKDIKSLKVQGAEAVAKKGLRVLEIILKKNYSKQQTLSTIKNLLDARPTEPMLKNCVKYTLASYDPLHTIKKLRIHFKDSRNEIIKYGAKKIPNNSIIFTHCHSSTVISIIKEAKRQGKHIEVHNTETRPLFQGRKTAKELANAGIPVKHYVDSAARLALKHADIAFIGADAITSETKVINKIGSELIAEAAEKQAVPLYCCTNSWKFDPSTIYGKETEIELRPEKEVWKTPPKRVKIFNYAFERVSPDLITAIISELGVYAPENFVSTFQKKYPELM